MNHARKQQRGFTIIELMLAMTFVAVLLVAIALTIVQIGAIYNRGMTLKEINQTGRIVSVDLSRSIAASSAFDPATSFYTNPAGGRLCTGNVSYIWNYASALFAGDLNVTTFVNNSDQIRLFRIPDPSSAYCARSGPGFTYQQVRTVDRLAGVELLKQGDRALNIHNVQLTSAPNGQDPVTGQRMYTMRFTIGTFNAALGQSGGLDTTRTACLPPSSVNADFTYCAVQQFTLVTRAGNRVN